MRCECKFLNFVILFLVLYEIVEVTSWSLFGRKKQSDSGPVYQGGGHIQGKARGRSRENGHHQQNRAQFHGQQQNKYSFGKGMNGIGRVKEQIVAFWNIVMNDQQSFDNAIEQRFVLESSGLLDKLDIVYYTTSGANVKNFTMSASDGKMKRLHHSGEELNEFKMLGQVYRFCLSNPKSKVLYFHNWGVVHNDQYEDPNLRINFRRALDCFVLNPHCIEQLDSFAVCGFRITIIPHVHFGGNYWWASCTHINTLIPPTAPLRNTTFLKATAVINSIPYTTNNVPFPDHPELGLGRHFAEAWVTSAPNFSVADCMTRADSSGFIDGPRVPRSMLKKHCPSHQGNDFANMLSRYDITSNKLLPNVSSEEIGAIPRLQYGKVCGASSILYDTKSPVGGLMQQAIANNAKYAMGVVQQSLVWYGSKPTLYLQWMNSTLGNTPVAVAESDSTMKMTMQQLADDTLVEKAVNDILVEHISPSAHMLRAKKHQSRIRQHTKHVEDTDFLHRLQTKSDGDHEFEYSDRNSTVAFWNIYAGGKYSHQINREQKFVLESSGLLDKLDVVYYTTIGVNASEYRIPGPKMKHLHHFRAGFEFPTLNLIFKFCEKNINSKVLYFHNKGSANYHITNTNFRKALDCNNLHVRCIEQLNNGFDVCGWRISPLPHVSFSGNYWWATCRHIRRLISPIAPIRNETFLNVTSTINPRRVNISDFKFHNYPNLGLGRYFAETWVTSSPRFKAADCMPAELNREYFFGYGVPWGLLIQKCPNWRQSFQNMVDAYEMNNTDYVVPRLEYGMQCAASDVFYYPGKFKESKNLHRFIDKYRKYYPTLVKRSWLWYGQPPYMQLEWLRFWNVTVPGYQ